MQKKKVGIMEQGFIVQAHHIYKFSVVCAERALKVKKYANTHFVAHA